MLNIDKGIWPKIDHEEVQFAVGNDVSSNIGLALKITYHELFTR
jgi:hypothetical protein